MIERYNATPSKRFGFLEVRFLEKAEKITVFFKISWKIFLKLISTTRANWFSQNLKIFPRISEQQNEQFFFLKFEVFFNENHPPTRHIKYKRIDFAPYNK